jgi:hypothetical protein
VTAGEHGGWMVITADIEPPGSLRLVIARRAWRGANRGLPLEIRFGGGSMIVVPATRLGNRIRAEIPAAEAKYFARDGAAGGLAQLVLPSERLPSWTLDLAGAAHALAPGGACFAPARVPPPASLKIARAPDANRAPVAVQDLPLPAPSEMASLPKPAAPAPKAAAQMAAPASDIAPVVARATAPAPTQAPATPKPQAVAEPPVSPQVPVAPPEAEATPAQVAAAQLAVSQQIAAAKAAQDAVAQRTQALNAALSGIMAQSYQQLKSAGVQFDDASALFNALLLAKPDFESFTPPVQVTTDDTGYIGNFVEVTPQGYTAYAGGFAPHGTESLVAMSGRLQTDGGGCSYVVGLVALSKLPSIKQLGGKPEYETYACDGLLAHRDDDTISKRVFGFTARVIKDPASVW